MNYDQFIEKKRRHVEPSGFDVSKSLLNPSLMDFQRDITHWALRVGKAAIFADCGLGKGQPVGSFLLTPKGWVKNSEIDIGNDIIASDGSPYKITGIYHKNKQPTYRIHFSDKSSFVVDLDHLHICRTNNDRQRGNPWRVISTENLLTCGNLRYGKHQKSRNYDIPIVKDVLFDKRELPICPYSLGVFLGDGHLKNSFQITCPDDQVVGRVLSELPDGVALHHATGYTWKLVTGLSGNKIHHFRMIFKKLGLHGKLSYDKFIPDSYLYASPEERLNLLRGLMDTDGYIDKTGTCLFYSSSEKLRDGVIHLVRSLGGIPTASSKIGKINGIEKRRCYIATFSLNTHNPFYLKRKAEKWNPNPRDNGRWIDRIVYECDQETICISVDSPDNSYVTENFIVTHNTFCQLEWANHVHQHTKKPVLIFAPLAVSIQTEAEAKKFGIEASISTSNADVVNGINISNYEKMHRYTPDQFGGIVLDESSILKAQFGKTRHLLNDFARGIPYRLACTATPAPNDLVEIVNHAEFLGIMSAEEIKALYFTQDGNNTQKFRLKRHAVSDFWKWVGSWAVALRQPSDLGYADDRFVLPKLHKHQIQVTTNAVQAGMLVPIDAVTRSEKIAERRATLEDRAHEAAALANSNSEQWVVWCELNDESALISRMIPDAIEVKGSDSSEHKEDALIGFATGKYRVIVTKPTIAGFGMNWQNCHNVVFVGLTDSYEQFYQAIRRLWRFGQLHEVDCYIITSNMDGRTVANIERKEREANKMYDSISHFMSREFNFDRVSRRDMVYERDIAKGDGWELYLGDSVKTIDAIDSDSIGLSVFSPPFPGMYVYTNSPHDMGNVSDMSEMIEQFRYLMDRDKLYRVMIPGRNVFIHITQGVAQKGRDGYVGLKDFRGDIIRMMSDIGWIHYGEVTIDKNPQLKATRTKDHGLMFKSLASDASKMHPALPDMLLQFRKPGENPTPIRAGYSQKYKNENGWVSPEQWINWARPVWYSQDYQPGTWRPDYTGDSFPDGIKETDVLNVSQARDTNDERHLCPLQLGVIERVVQVWSNPGDIVYSPFAGIGSEGYVALKRGRKFVGCELKRSYWLSAIKNLKDADSYVDMPLFNLVAKDRV